MKEFLRKIKLIDDWTTHLPISQQNFVDRLSAITEERELGLFSDVFMPFKSSRKEYAGHVGFDEFKIRRRMKFSQTNQNLAFAEGTFNENNGQLTIEAEINGFSSRFILLYTVVFLFTFVPAIFTNSGIGILMSLLFGIGMLFVLYLIMRTFMERLKYDLEREFFYLTKK